MLKISSQTVYATNGDVFAEIFRRKYALSGLAPGARIVEALPLFAEVLMGKDIAQMVLFILMQRSNVNVSRIVVVPNQSI